MFHCPAPSRLPQRLRQVSPERSWDPERTRGTGRVSFARRGPSSSLWGPNRSHMSASAAAHRRAQAPMRRGSLVFRCYQGLNGTPRTSSDTAQSLCSSRRIKQPFTPFIVLRKSLPLWTGAGFNEPVPPSCPQRPAPEQPPKEPASPAACGTGTGHRFAFKRLMDRESLGKTDH